MRLFGGVRFPMSRPSLANVMRLDVGCIPMLVEMRRHGILLDTGVLAGLEARLTEKQARIQAEIDGLVGRPLYTGSGDKVADFLFRELELVPGRLTPSQKRPQVGEDALLKLRDQHPVVPLILEWRGVEKLLDTYIRPLPGMRDENGRIHTRLKNTTARTGRLACVSGSTLLQTSRGLFRFDDYEPRSDDTVLSHTGRECKVLRKFYKGVDTMYRVCLTDGSAVECTKDHRLFTPRGWTPVGDLSTGEKVYSVSLQEVYSRWPERGAGRGALSVQRETHCAGDGPTGRDDLSHRDAYSQNESRSEALHRREGSAVFQEQSRPAEPDARENGRQAPQLDRGCERQQGIPDAVGGWGAVLHPSHKICRNVGDPRLADTVLSGDASHRLESTQRRPGQLGSNNPAWALGATCKAHEVAQITPLGALAVWDIEVDGDHSYLAQGLLHHNSEEPNLQNQPIQDEDGRLIRSAFCAGPGCVIADLDLSQIEMVVAAHESGDPKMREIFRWGLDIHIKTACALFGLDYEQVQARCAAVKAGSTSENDVAWVKEFWQTKRLPSKTLGFQVLYGCTAQGLQDGIVAAGGPLIPLEDCERYIAGWFEEYSGVRDWVEAQHQRARRYGMVWDMFGRPRLIPEVHSALQGVRAAGLREAGNHPIQSGAGGILKLGMAETQGLVEMFQSNWPSERCWPLLPVHDELLFELGRPIAEDFCGMAKSIMETAVPLDVPTKAEYGIGENWLEAHK